MRIKRAAVPATPLPSKAFFARDGLLGATVAMLTNWSTFTDGVVALPVELPGCTHQLHMPLIKGYASAAFISSWAIIFTAKPGMRINV